MNIDDYTIDGELDPLQYVPVIFNRQRELISKYIEIERSNGYYHPGFEAINIDGRKDQAFIKDMYERCIEEVGESLEAFYLTSDVHHAKEEMIDSLHFLVELCIIAGIQEDLEKLPSLVCIQSSIGPHNSVEANFLFEVSDRLTNFIMYGGIAMNNLKQKPWKCTEVPTDEKKFKHDMIKAYSKHKELLNLFMSDKEIMEYYIKKSKVNEFRQQSNY